MKFYAIQVRIRDGDNEYYQWKTLRTRILVDIGIKKLLSEFFGEGTYEYNGAFFSKDDCQAVSLSQWREISEEQYKTITEVLGI